MSTMTVYASQLGAKLDSSVFHGGGTDDTQVLQAALDLALTRGSLHLVLDGAALISKALRIHSNTTIECPTQACGLYLADGSDCCILRNADWDVEKIQNENIAILGGTFNHNARGQAHDSGEEFTPEHPCTTFVVGFEFYGVRDLTLRDVTIRNQRTFTMLLASWEHVTMENIQIDLIDHMDGENQDGLHFFGPGRYLTLRNIRGNSSDDFIALAPDEVDLKSSIEDVLIDGVMLAGADQAIRMLSRGEGRLDRVTVRNVTGDYHSFGFFINPWFDSEGGQYGNIVIENVDLRHLAPNYDYRPPFLFDVAGHVESLTLRNIYNHRSADGRQMFIFGGRYNYDLPEKPAHRTHIERLIVDGVYVDEADEKSMEDVYMHVRSRVDELVVKNVHLKRTENLPAGGKLIRVDENGTIGKLVLQDVYTDGLDAVLDAPADAIAKKYESNVFND